MNEQVKHAHGPVHVVDRKDARGNPCGWSVWPNFDRPYSDSPRGNQICYSPDGTTPHAKANMDFIADAFNVHHETGLTPRQLAEQRAILLRFARIVQRQVVCCTDDENPADGAEDCLHCAAAAAIAKATGNTE